MRTKLLPQDLANSDKFELLAEVSHDRLREFVLSQVRHEKVLIKVYSIYQLLIMMLYVYILTRSIVLTFKGFPEPLYTMIYALIFSFSILVMIHELLHAFAYLLAGARRISFGMNLRKFIFYALADQQVITKRAFQFVALAPFVLVKILCLIAVIIFFNETVLFFYLSVMCLHSLFCAGDMAMLAFYNLNSGKEIFNYDDKSERKTYFYVRK
jgi:hypothetical protein